MIHRILLLAAMSIMTLSATKATAQKNTVQWYSFEKAVEMNKEQPRKILIDVYTDWCGWCKKMKRQTFNHPAIARYINKNFYPVRFNAESGGKVRFNGRTFGLRKRSGRNIHELAIYLLQGKMSYPSVAYLDGKNRLITAVPGFYKPKDMEPILKYFVKGAYKNQKFKKFKKNYQPTLVE